MENSMRQQRCLGCMEMFPAEYDICPYCGYRVGTPPEEMYHLQPGTVLYGKYLIGKVLGFGGFGITYVGWDEKLCRKVAIKEYLPGECSTRIPGSIMITVFEGEKETQFQKGIETFLDESRKLMRFQNLPAIVKTYDCFEENGTAYFVMECLEGSTLRELLGEDGKMSFEDALHIIQPILRDLKEVHKTGFIHRDIAPDNIFITTDGEAKLLDFGSARYIALAQSKSLSVIIKTGYAPPEQYQTHGNQGTWTDVYSLAATMYRMLTGIAPEDAMERIAEDHLLAPSKVGVSLPKDQETAILNALNTNVGSRTKTLEDFENELLSKVTVVRQKDGKKEKKSSGKRTFASMIAVAAVILLLGGAGLFAVGAVHLGGMSQTGREIDYSTGLIGNYVGYAYDDVVEAATENGIRLEIINTSNEANGEALSDDTIGKILEQSPEAGSSVEDSDGTIQVIVSAGTKKAKVGDYVGYSFEDAQQTAEDKHINLTEETTTEDATETIDTTSNIIPGYVLTQSVESGKKVPKDSTMTVIVSSGNTSIDINTTFSMPSLTGKTFAEALKTAEKKGFYIGIEGHEYSTTQKVGTICAQSVKSKTTVGGGTQVLLTISDGPEQMTVPDVVGKELEAAREALSAQKLEVSVDYAYNDDYGSQYSSGQVMTQSIDGGETVDEGTTVTLIVSQGSKPVATTSQKKSTSGSSSSGGSSGGSSSGGSSSKKSSSDDDDSIDYDSLDRVN